MLRSLTEVSSALPWFVPAVVGLLGACLGSFLNVVIVRLPAGRSVVRPGSHCACGAPISWYDNVPIVSWFLLRGRARCCGRPISGRYPTVEALTAALFVACWLRLPPGVAVCGWILAGGLVAATFIDLEHLLIPDVFTIGLGAAGIALSFLVPELHGQQSPSHLVDCLRSGADGVVGLVAGSGLLLWIALVAEAALRQEAMGFGDIKFVGAIGAFCGWHGAVFAVFGGAVVGTVWTVAALAWQKVSGRPALIAPRAETPAGEAAPLGLGAHVPFGPMLAVATLLYLLALHRPVEAWFDQLSGLI
jgi:leader peptidase (prepilin peptidase)/N-methyltransferase